LCFADVGKTQSDAGEIPKKHIQDSEHGENLKSGIQIDINHLTPNDLQRHRAVSPLRIKIPSKKMLEKATNTPIIHSVY
jgi:hypothetical protein